MFNCPQKNGCLDYKQHVDLNVIDRLIEKTTTKPQLFDADFAKTAQRLLPDHVVPVNVEEALNLYKEILNAIKESEDTNL